MYPIAVSRSDTNVSPVYMSALLLSVIECSFNNSKVSQSGKRVFLDHHILECGYAMVWEHFLRAKESDTDASGCDNTWRGCLGHVMCKSTLTPPALLSARTTPKLTSAYTRGFKQHFINVPTGAQWFFFTQTHSALQRSACTQFSPLEVSGHPAIRNVPARSGVYCASRNGGNDRKT